MSILDHEEDIINDDEYIVRQFIKENYSTSKLYINRSKDGTYVVDCTTVVVKNKLIEHLTNNLFKWGEVYKFDASNCTTLRTAEGAPKCCAVFTCEGTPERFIQMFNQLIQ